MDTGVRRTTNGGESTDTRVRSRLGIYVSFMPSDRAFVVPLKWGSQGNNRSVPSVPVQGS